MEAMQVAVMLQTVDCHRSPVIVPQPSTQWMQQTSSPWGDGAAEGDCGWGTEPGITPINLTSVRTDCSKRQVYIVPYTHVLTINKSLQVFLL